MLVNTMTVDWQLGDVQTSTKGIKSAPISDKKGNPVFCMLTQKDQPLSAPFGASAYNDPTAIRHNICFRCHEQLESAMTNVDAYMANYVKEHSQHSFKGKHMTYKPCLSIKEGCAALLRAKVNVSGSKACRFWTSTYARCDCPEDIRVPNFVPRINVRSLWIMGSDCGLTLECADIMFDDQQETCPFLDENPFTG